MAEKPKDLFIFNSLTRTREKFEPIEPGKVGMYVCGITPYDQCHLGHARCYVVFDVIHRTLERFGYQVKYIQNFTDVDDKIIARAKERVEDAKALADRYIQDYFHWMDVLNVKRADVYPRVTENISEIQKLIAQLITRGLAYQVETGVYYAVRKFKDYGRLSGRTLDDLKVGARVEGEPDKKDPLDFALWKRSHDPTEPAWDSPWGRGRPGWHIECSVMSMKELSEEFDIHGGGQDLTFPHHENEIAQSCGATGKGFARYWLHNGFVNVNKEKMSKSLGNFFTLSEILKDHDPMAVRYFLISQHYRSPIDYSDTEIKVAKAAWERIAISLDRIRWIKRKKGDYPTQKKEFEEIAAQRKKEFNEALADDFNTPRALAVLHEWVSFVNGRVAKMGLTPGEAEVSEKVLSDMADPFGLRLPEEFVWTQRIQDLAKQRREAREARNWVEADALRVKLRELGVIVEDTPDGQLLKKA